MTEEKMHAEETEVNREEENTGEAVQAETEVAQTEAQEVQTEEQAVRKETEEVQAAREEEIARKEAEVSRREEAAAKREEAAAKRDEEAGRREEEAGRREEAAAKREEELTLREAEISQREEEAARAQEAARQNPKTDGDSEWESEFMAEKPKKRRFFGRNKEDDFMRDKWILSRIRDEDLMDYLVLEQKRHEQLERSRDIREKRIFTAFMLAVSLAAGVAMVYLLKDNPTIFVNILYIGGILGGFWFWKNFREK